jgi:hypothetical protein
MAKVTASTGTKAGALVKASVSVGDAKERKAEAARILKAVREENARRLAEANAKLKAVKALTEQEKAEAKALAEADRKGAIESAPAAFKSAAANVETGRKATITAALQTGVALSRLLASGVISAGKQKADSGKMSLAAYVRGDVFKPMAVALGTAGVKATDIYTWATRAASGVKVLLAAGADSKMLEKGFASKMSLRALHMLGYAAGRKGVEAADVGRYALEAVRTADDIDAEFAKEPPNDGGRGDGSEDGAPDTPDETAAAILDAHKADKAEVQTAEVVPVKVKASGKVDFDKAYNRAFKAMDGMRDAVKANAGGMREKLAQYKASLQTALDVAFTVKELTPLSD